MSDVPDGATSQDGRLHEVLAMYLEVAQRNEQLMELAQAMAGLPEAMREVLLLKHCQGWSVAEIGDHLGRSRPSVASLLRRGLQHLRDHLHDGD